MCIWSMRNGTQTARFPPDHECQHLLKTAYIWSDMLLKFLLHPVLAEIVSRGTRHAEHKAKVVYSFGNADCAAVCAQAQLTLENISPIFPEEGASCTR